MSADGGRERGAPPEHHDAATGTPDQHPSDDAGTTPPHGDPLRGEVVPGTGPRPDRSRTDGTRHGADATPDDPPA